MFSKTIKIGDKYYIDVYYYFNTTRVLDFYGLIKKNDFMEFKLVNGDIIKLHFLENSIPTIKHKYSYYENSLFLNKNDVNRLKASSISKVRVHFTKGTKNWDASENTDLLIKQLECVTK